MKINSTVQEYKTPICKTVYVAAQTIVCASNYGDAGQAGGGFNDDNTTNYGDDF